MGGFRPQAAFLVGLPLAPTKGYQQKHIPKGVPGQRGFFLRLPLVLGGVKGVRGEAKRNPPFGRASPDLDIPQS